ncbi:MAG: GAF domain-containing protein [Anaerolineae bacterium]|nr:GAF domain-containing protein [Anaerolineae bacterium]
MAYLLILLVGFYAALAAMIGHRFPRAVSSIVMVLYAGGAALSTGGYLVLGTTTDRVLAEVVAILVVLLSSWTVLVLLPLALVGLYLEAWLRAHYWRVIVFTALGMTVLDVAFLGLRAAQDMPIVTPVTSSAWVHWALSHVLFVWPYGALVIVGSLLLYGLTIGWTLYHRRLTLWRDAVPLTLVALTSLIIPMLSPLAGGEWLVTVVALGYVPPVTLLAVRVAGARQKTLTAAHQQRLQAERLQEATYEVVTSADLDGALRAGLMHLARAITFDRAHVGLLEAGDQWRFRAVYSPGEPIPLNHSITITLYPLALDAVHTRRPVLVTDTRAEPRWRSGRATSKEIRSWIGVPLLVRNAVIGLLALDSLTPGSFSEEHLQIARTYAQQFAVAIDNFRLFEEAQRQNRALSALNSVFAAGNEALTGENRLENVLIELLRALELPAGALYQRSGQGKLRLCATSGLSDADIARLGSVAGPQDVCVGQAEGWDSLSMSLMAHGAENGLLIVCYPASAPLDDDLRALLSSIGQQLGVVLENAALFEDTARRAALSTDLGRLSLAISAQLDSGRVLDLLCEESLGIFDVQGAYLWLTDGDYLVGAAAFGRGAEQFKGQRLARSDTALLPARVLSDWRPRAANGVQRSDALPNGFVALTGAQAVLAVPLLKADMPVGTLLLVNTQTPDAFDEGFAEQVGLFGVQAALAIENANLFEEVRRRLDHLRLVNEVGRYSAAILSQMTLVEGVAHKLFEILGYTAISLLTLEDGELAVRLTYLDGAVAPVPDDPERYRLALQMAALAIERSEPVLQNQECLLEADEAGESAVECCSLGVPLIVADEVIGVLVVERRGHHSIRQEDLDVLEPLAAQLAISLSNARLYEKVREHTIELEARVIERTAKIREQQERTEAILRSVADAVIVFDLSGRVVMTNPVARALFDRYGQDVRLNEHISELVQRVIAQDDVARDATEIIELNGISFQAKAARAMEGEALIGSVVVLRDISRLQELDRLKDRFISTVSHELRTPLANLKLYLQLLEKGSADRHSAYLDVMRREALRLERLIDDLLQISRLQGEQQAQRRVVRAPVDVERLIALVIEHNIAWAESDGKALTCQPPEEELPPISGDSDQIERALTNLVSNAIRYTPQGGQITVRSRLAAAHENQDWVIIEVSDTGIGIPAGELTMIFDRFFRASNVSPTVPGTGLGLAILRDIIGLHGGKVEVESQQDQGSIFRLWLPVLDS